jgi:hypothetical protein
MLNLRFHARKPTMGLLLEIHPNIKSSTLDCTPWPQRLGVLDNHQ